MLANFNDIFPVFAGMIPTVPIQRTYHLNFPRIRGDDPYSGKQSAGSGEFSPYSRG